MIATYRRAWFLFAVILLVTGAPVGAGGWDYAGDETCADCHEDKAEGIAKSVHAEIPEGWGDSSAGSCEGCHGPGAAHANSNGEKSNFAFGPEDSAREKTDRCLACHAANIQNMTALSTEHLRGGVACSDCHSSHKYGDRDKLLPANTSDLCLTCHQEIDQATRLYPRHRIHEGVNGCTDCHNPHAPSTRSQLGGFKNDTCYGCHTDKQGPFVHEHLSGLVEGCTACHSPHGSVNRHMLKYQNQADLCLSCHAVLPSFHSRFDHTTNCTNCHALIHGSNLAESFLE